MTAFAAGPDACHLDDHRPSSTLACPPFAAPPTAAMPAHSPPSLKLTRSGVAGKSVYHRSAQYFGRAP